MGVGGSDIKKNVSPGKLTSSALCRRRLPLRQEQVSESASTFPPSLESAEPPPHLHLDHNLRRLEPPNLSPSRPGVLHSLLARPLAASAPPLTCCGEEGAQVQGARGALRRLARDPTPSRRRERSCASGRAQATAECAGPRARPLAGWLAPRAGGPGAPGRPGSSP